MMLALRKFAINLILVLAAVLESSIGNEQYKVKVTCFYSRSPNLNTNETGTSQPVTLPQTPQPHDETKARNDMVPAPSPDIIALARDIARKKQAFEYCKVRNSTIIRTEDGEQCVATFSMVNGTHNCIKEITIKVILGGSYVPVDQNTESTVYIAGNSVGFVFLGALFATYSCFKDLQTSYGRCVVILSIVIITKNVIQIISYFSGKQETVCKTVAIFCHWLLLSMFCWMASIASDLLATFYRVRLPSPLVQKRRFRAYTIFSFTAPTLVVLICLAIELFSDKILYGLYGVCFISEYWANIASFVTPVGAVLFFNIVCLACTVYFIRAAKKKSQCLFKNDEKKPSLSFTIMTIKLSLLLGFGWVIGYVGGILQNSILLYIFLFLDSFQGVFIYFAFCCNQRVFSFYKRGFSTHVRRIGTSSSRIKTDETGF